MFADDGFTLHLELAHGLLATRGESIKSVIHCEKCELYSAGELAIRRHKLSHLDKAVQTMKDDPLCLEAQGTLQRLNLCPFHAMGDTLPDLKHPPVE